MPLHMLRVSLRLLGIQLRRATFQVLVRLATRVEPALEPLAEDSGDAAPAHWLRDIRAYGQEPHWMSFVAPRLQQQAELHQSISYPASNPPVGEMGYEQTDRQPAPSPVSGDTRESPSNDAHRDEKPRHNESVRSQGRLRFPQTHNPEHAEGTAMPVRFDRLEPEVRPMRQPYDEVPEHVRITYSRQVTRPVSATWEHSAEDIPAQRSLRVQTISGDTAGHTNAPPTGTNGISEAPEHDVANTGYTHPPTWEHAKRPVTRDEVTRGTYPPHRQFPAINLDAGWNASHTATAREEALSETPGLAAHQWPELPERSQRLVQLEAAAEVLERHHEEWKHRERLDSEQRGIEWNESPS